MTTTRAMTSGAAPQVVTMTLTPTFKLMFLSVLGLTVLSLLVTCVMMTVGGPPEIITVEGKSRDNPAFGHWTAVVTTFESTFKLGFGAIVGLVGGKASGA